MFGFSSLFLIPRRWFVPTEQRILSFLFQTSQAGHQVLKGHQDTGQQEGVQLCEEC